jgi:arylsulfatase
MKRILKLLILSTIPSILASSHSAPRPNIVIVMADDMGFSDIGCYGSEISTPNIDRMAENGLRFTQFYNTARCCPTRASLLTGLYSHQAGVGHMVNKKNHPSYRGYLNDRCVTIGEVLKEAGYTTLLSGKWHVGEDRPHWPVDRGFDRSYSIVSGGGNYFAPDPWRIFAMDDERIDPAGGDYYITDAFSDHAAKFIEEYGKEEAPFFLYLPYTSPHWPLHAWPEDIEKYRGKYREGWDHLRKQRLAKMSQLGIVDPYWELTERDEAAPAWEEVEDKDLSDLKMAVYAAQIDRMDQGIGKVLEAVRGIGEEENTLVLFLADNGGCAEEIDRGVPGLPPGGRYSFMSYGLPWANASNTPFREYKHWVHEGGISSPLVAYWPNVIKEKGRLTHQVGHVIDLMATCVDLAGAEYPKTFKGKEITPLEGQSLAPIFRGEEREGHEAVFWEHEGNRAVRKGDLKLVSEWNKKENRNGAWELYDLKADRTETNDLTSKHPETVEELSALYEAWAKRANVLDWDEVGKLDRS